MIVEPLPQSDEVEYFQVQNLIFFVELLSYRVRKMRLSSAYTDFFKLNLSVIKKSSQLMLFKRHYCE